MDINSEKSLEVIKLHVWVMVNLLFVSVLFNRPEVKNVVMAIAPMVSLSSLLLRSSHEASSATPRSFRENVILFVVVILAGLLGWYILGGALNNAAWFPERLFVHGIAIVWSSLFVGVYVWRLFKLRT